MSLTQYYTATSLGEFIADVGAMAVGSTTYEWILGHEFTDKDPEEWKWPYDIPCWVFTQGRNGDFASARYSVVRPPA